MNIKIIVPVCLLALVMAGGAADPGKGSTSAPLAQAGIIMCSFRLEPAVCRANRPATVGAVIKNNGETAVTVKPKLVLPGDVKIVKTGVTDEVQISGHGEVELVWLIQADNAKDCELSLEIVEKDKLIARSSLSLRFLPPREVRKLSYIPDPVPVKTPILIGAHHCPLWEADKHNLWANVHKHPERTPALGFYAQENPQISDWETKWAVEHGISFFIYCWYRASQGEPVKMKYGSAIHDALFKSKFVDKMKFTIMWENQHKGVAGVADEKDLMTNLLPFWIENYFRNPIYLKVDNKPLLFIYRPEFLIKDLGSIENVNKAFELMRQVCRDAGFAGLYLLGEYRGLDAKHLSLMKQLGLDYTFAYCWHVPNNPTPEQAIQSQMNSIRKTQEMGVIPQVVTVTQGWSGWRDEGSIWKIPPNDYERLLCQAKEFISSVSTNELGSKMLILDNWNEWGEGHYLAPYREFGFGYLDAVRKVFSNSPEAHEDLLPEDVGFGPYDVGHIDYMKRTSPGFWTGRKSAAVQ